MEFLKIAKIISNIHKVQENYREMKEDAEKAKVDKYCVHCGAKFKTGISLFCPQCGAADPIQKEETVKSAKRTALKVLGYILFFAIIIFGFLFYFQYQAVQEVRQGSPTNYPDFTLEEAFDAFFESPKWSYGEDCGEYAVICFSGDCLYREQEVTANLEIWSYDSTDKFSIQSLDFNGVPQSDEMLNLLLTTVYENYQAE